MASYNELSADWNYLFDKFFSLDKWSKLDIQSIEKFGRTLLDCYKELEIILKEQKSTIDEQTKEIMYLNKHKMALHEVHDSYLKDNEQLEINMQNLERTNQLLKTENKNDKKQIKELQRNIETLELRNEELKKQMEETRQTLHLEMQRNEHSMIQKHENTKNITSSSTTTINSEVQLRPIISEKSNLNVSIFNNSASDVFRANTTPTENCSFVFETSLQRKNANSTVISESDTENDKILKLINRLENAEKSIRAEKKRSADLERELSAVIQENSLLLSYQKTNKTDIRASIHNELTNLVEMNHCAMCSHSINGDNVSSNSGNNSNRNIIEHAHNRRTTESSSGFSDDASNKCAQINECQTEQNVHFLYANEHDYDIDNHDVNDNHNDNNDNVNRTHVQHCSLNEYVEFNKHIVVTAQKVTKKIKKSVAEDNTNNCDLPFVSMEDVVQFKSSAFIKLQCKNTKQLKTEQNQTLNNTTVKENSTANMSKHKQIVAHGLDVAQFKCAPLTSITVSAAIKRKRLE